MKTQRNDDWLWLCGTHPTARKAQKSNGDNKKKTTALIGSLISPDSHNLRGEARAAGFLRQTPAP